MTLSLRRMRALLVVVAGAFAFSACDTVTPDAPAFESQAPGMIMANTMAGAAIGSTPLVAGQNETVGTVTTHVDGGDLVVTYTITEPEWCISEWHLDVGLSKGDLLNGKKKSPAPGTFPYGQEEDCALTVTQRVALSSIDGYTSGATVYIAAHAVVNTGERCGAFIYGIQHESGDIYRIYLNDLNDPNDNEAVLNYDVSEAIVISSNADYPNSLATGEGKLYFSQRDRDFYEVDIATGAITQLGQLDYVAASGVYADGAFWYVPQADMGPDDLRRVVIDPFSKDAYCTNFSPDSRLQFGDIEISGTTIYGSAREGSNATQGRFFTLDISGGKENCVYTQVGGANRYQLQLAFDQNDTLIGHAANPGGGVYDLGEFYTVEFGASSVNVTPLGKAFDEAGQAYRFNDLSRGPEYDCEVREETAWAAGTRFTERGNWATYFTYDTSAR